ncbi:MAG TPA: WD40 repeat domain-containing protein [Planctomycetota bacterium]|nr:WD40 repeat domain-containing protein [Planctomycetota bacterium]
MTHRVLSAALAAFAAAAVGVARAQAPTPLPPALSDFVAERTPDDLPEVVATFDDDPAGTAFAAPAAALAARGFGDAPSADALRAAWVRYRDAADDAPPSFDSDAVRFVLDGDRFAITLRPGSGDAAASRPTLTLERRRRLNAVHGTGWRDGEDETTVLAFAGEALRVDVLRFHGVGAGGGAALFPIRLSGPRNWIQAVHVGPKATWIASGDYDGRVCLWRRDADGTYGLRRASLEHAGPAWGVWLLGDSHVLSCGADGVARLRPLPATGEVRFSVAHDLDLRTCAFDPKNGRRLLSGGVDHAVRLWDVELGYAVDLPSPHAGPVSGVAFGGGSIVSASVDGEVAWYDAAGSRPAPKGVRSEGVKINGLAVRADSDDAYVCGGDGRMIRLALDKPALAVAQHRGEAKGAAFDASGRRLLSCAGERALRLTDLDAAGAATRSEPLPAGPEDGHWHCCGFRPDGRVAAAGALSGAVSLFDVVENRLLATLRGHAGSVEGCAWSPDGARLLTGGADGTVRVWDPAKGVELFAVRASRLTVYAAAYDPDGVRIATASQDGALRLWSAQAFRLLRTLGGEPEARGAAFDASGQLLATACDDGVRLWDLDRVRLLAHLPTDLPVAAVAFVDDDAAVAAFGDDGAAWVFETASGELIEGEEPPALPAATPVPSFRELARRYGPWAAPQSAVSAFAARTSDDGATIAVAETHGVVRVVRREGAAPDGAVEVLELRAMADGCWATRRTRVGGGGAGSGVAEMSRADDGGRVLALADDGSCAPLAAPARPGGRIEVRPPAPIAVDEGDGALLEITATNAGDVPLYQLRIETVVARDLALLPLAGVVRLDPGSSAVLQAWIERKPAPAGAESREGSVAARMLPARITAAGGVSAAVDVLVR